MFLVSCYAQILWMSWEILHSIVVFLSRHRCSDWHTQTTSPQQHSHNRLFRKPISQTPPPTIYLFTVTHETRDTQTNTRTNTPIAITLVITLEKLHRKGRQNKNNWAKQPKLDGNIILPFLLRLSVVLGWLDSTVGCFIISWLSSCFVLSISHVKRGTQSSKPRHKHYHLILCLLLRSSISFLMYIEYYICLSIIHSSIPL